MWCQQCGSGLNEFSPPRDSTALNQAANLILLRDVWIICFCWFCTHQIWFYNLSLPSSLSNHPSLLTYLVCVLLPTKALWDANHVGISQLHSFGLPTAVPFGLHHISKSNYKDTYTSLAIFSSTYSNHLTFPFYWMNVTTDTPALLNFLQKPNQYARKFPLVLPFSLHVERDYFPQWLRTFPSDKSQFLLPQHLTPLLHHGFFQLLPEISLPVTQSCLHASNSAVFPCPLPLGALWPISPRTLLGPYMESFFPAPRGCLQSTEGSLWPLGFCNVGTLL